MSTWRNVLAFADALIRLLLRLLQQRILSQVKTKGVPLPLPWALAFEKVAPIILPSLNSGTPDFIRGSISCSSYFHLKNYSTKQAKYISWKLYFLLLHLWAIGTYRASTIFSWRRYFQSRKTERKLPSSRTRYMQLQLGVCDACSF